MSELLRVNVNTHVEKKGNLSYLSWAWAWAEVLKVDPTATWVVHTYGPQGSEQPCMWIGETAMVHTSVTVKGLRRECMLPVMDHKNFALKNPDARKISDAIMRCMTKAIALHGLGLYIYAGEDLPPDEGDIPQTGKDRERVLKDAADTCIALFADGKEVAAYEAISGITDNEEKMWLWSYLHPHTALRSSIKKQAYADAEKARSAQKEAA